MVEIEENFYELYKSEKERVIILKECEFENEDKKSIASFDSEGFKSDEEEDHETLKKTDSKESTLDEDLENKLNLKLANQKKH